MLSKDISPILGGVYFNNSDMPKPNLIFEVVEL